MCLAGLDLFRGLDEELEHDLVYTDDEDDSDQFYPPIAGDKVLEPHPRIKQLTDAVLRFCVTMLDVKC